MNVLSREKPWLERVLIGRIGMLLTQLTNESRPEDSSRAVKVRGFGAVRAHDDETSMQRTKRCMAWFDTTGIRGFRSGEKSDQHEIRCSERRKSLTSHVSFFNQRTDGKTTITLARLCTTPCVSEVIAVRN